MIATTNMPTTRNNEEVNTLYKRNFIRMLRFVYLSRTYYKGSGRLMSKFELELASMVLGPWDKPHEYALYEGYVLNERHIFIMDEGELWLRSVHKDPHMKHLYIDGDSGGLIVANAVEGIDTRELIETIITELKQINGLQFLLDIMLWTEDRGDINLKLETLR